MLRFATPTVTHDNRGQPSIAFLLLREHFSYQSDSFTPDCLSAKFDSIRSDKRKVRRFSSFDPKKDKNGTDRFN